ncbi:hypothetical protein GDO81_017010 [Engystomops pustulosus]|uniref:Globin domain-containing protein n=1 Tax=Engystomops pustulosus TaxID=76066 RepID=A0AAV7AEQ3_ENGPU|nr:hypothetical protein GDO81_017010 [Engystomops pustulosus]
MNMMNSFAVLIIWSKIILAVGLPKVQQPNSIPISSTASEIAVVKDFLAKIAPQAKKLGAETLERLFLGYPETKNYFAHFNTSHGSDDLLKQGGKIFNALGYAASHLDNPDGILSALKKLHPYNLRDPDKFHMMSSTINHVMTSNFEEEFPARIQASWDNFMDEVYNVLLTKYR